MKKKSFSAKKRSLIVAKAALDKKADNVVIMKMRDVATICDFFIVCSANSERKIRAVANNIIDELEKLSVSIQHTEGYEDASWILIDCYDVVVHVFRSDLREFYDLEHLWAEAPRTLITEESVKEIKKKAQATD